MKHNISNLNNKVDSKLEAFFISYAELASQYVVFLDINLNIIYVNRSFSNFSGYSKENSINKNFTDLCREVELGVFPTPNFPHDYISTVNLITNQITQEKIYLFWQLQNIANNAEQIFGYLLFGDDVTQVQTIKKDFESADVVVKNLLANLPISIFWKDAQGVYQGCNDFVVKLAGLKSKDALIGKTDFDIWPSSGKTVNEIDKQVIESGEIKIVEEIAYLENNHKAYFVSHKLPMFDANKKIIGVMGLAFDITERKGLEIELKKAKEAAEAANEAKSDFIANMSHDLRTPLVAICGIGEILKFERSFSVEERKGLASDLAKSAEVLLQLVDNILDFSKLKSEKLPIISEAFDLREIIETVTIMMAELANKKNIKLLIYYSEACPRYLIGDPHRVNRIVSNLIGNAIKFTEQGHVFVSVELIRQQEFEVELQIVVEDTGIGIPTEKVEHVFDRFYRVDPSYRGRYQGTGLGLNIVKQFVESMGGTIGVNSQAGYGATFHCSIPFKLPNTIEIKSTWRRHYANIPILIVDDYKSRGKMLLRQLHSNYSQLATSDQLLEMLTQARVAGNPYKIIIVDDEIQHIQLDEMISLISEEEGYDQTLLMLFLNSTNNRLATKYKEIGYFECVVKPIQPTELTNVLTKCWQEWSSKFQNENTALREFRARVLLVEDNPVSLRILKMLLEQFNCQIDSAGTAKETIDAMMSKEYDVVFLDLGLPDTDGITLAKQIKSLQWKNNRIPLVALTAHATEVDRRRCIEAGMAGYLKKPASSQSLKRLLVNVLFNRSK